METLSRDTARLTLRNLRDSDLDALATYRCDAHAFRYIDDPMSRAEVAAHIAQCRDGWSRRAGETLNLAVELRGEGVVIGEVMLRYTNPKHRQAEFGVALDPRRHRQAFGVEALVGLFRYGFEELHLHRLIGFTDVENPVAAVRALDILGLRREGRLRKNAYRHGQWRDEYLVALLDEEWPAVRERCRNLLGPALADPAPGKGQPGCG